jgi:hypothetical protein
MFSSSTVFVFVCSNAVLPEYKAIAAMVFVGA